MEIELSERCSDKPEFLARATLSQCQSLGQVAEKMRCSGLFQSVSFLPNACIVRARLREKSIIIFKDGKIIINCVRDLDDARHILSAVVHVLTESFSST